MGRRDAAARTRRSFGMLWRETSAGRVREHGATHVERAAAAAHVTLPTEGERILDAGCGAGRDLVALARRHPMATVVGLDVHEAVHVAAGAAAEVSNAYVVRGSVLDPPFLPASFDFVYCYGVLHHTDDPAAAFRALAALVAPGGRLLIYVYTDLREEPLLRVLLQAITAVRRLTTRLPPRTVLRLARLLAPVVFLVFGVPAALLRLTPATRRFANKLPFNFANHPASAVGDLYDRFSAPVEHRHGRRELEEWYRDAGLRDALVTSMADARGWVAVGRVA